MEVPRQYWRAWPGIRDRFSPANRAVEACLAAPRVPSRAQADVPVSYPRVRCPFAKQRISSVEFFDTHTGMCVSAARADLVGDPYRLRLYAPDRSAGRGLPAGRPHRLVKGATAARARWRDLAQNGRSVWFGALHSSPNQPTQAAVLQDFYKPTPGLEPGTPSLRGKDK
jgi:hypothetical protein